jgi:hypothetical protein
MFLKKQIANFIFPPRCSNCATFLEEDLLFCKDCFAELKLSFELASPWIDPDLGQIYPLFHVSRVSHRLIDFAIKEESKRALNCLYSFILLKLAQEEMIWPDFVLKRLWINNWVHKVKNDPFLYLHNQLYKELNIPLLRFWEGVKSDYRNGLIVVYDRKDLLRYFTKKNKDLIKEKKWVILTLLSEPQLFHTVSKK